VRLAFILIALLALAGVFFWYSPNDVTTFIISNLQITKDARRTQNTQFTAIYVRGVYADPKT
jgi:hypothetical protein